MEIPYVVNPRKDTGLFNSKIAIWLFLASEVMLFGGLFSGYVFLRIGADYPWPERTLPVLPGLINTFILIFSSVTVVFAWASLKMRKWRQFQIFMSITVLCAVAFMGFKGLEYYVKFHHQALRMKDFTMVEGHIGYVTKGEEHEAGHGGEGAGHSGHQGEEKPDYLLDVHGDKIEANHHVFSATAISFDLARFHEEWAEDMIAEAKRQNVDLKLAEGFDFNAADAEKPDEDLAFEKGAPLSVDLLDSLREAFLENRAYNAKWRTRYLREAWDLKHADVKENDLLGKAAFTADYPKGSELPPDEREDAYVRWKAGMRSRMAADVGIDGVKLSTGETIPVLINGRSYAQIERPVQSSATFTCSDELVLRYPSHDVITDYKEGNKDISLRDATKLSGHYLPSPMEFHYVDGIDFQHLVMDAEKKGLDPEIAIENCWLVQNNKDVADLWEMHKQAVVQLDEILTKKYGYKKGKDGKPLLDWAGNPIPDRVPTHKDRYRMGWQEVAYYMNLLVKHRESGKPGVPEVKLDPDANSAPRVKMTVTEHFKGPDYHHRTFPQAVIPRSQVLMDSKFTPQWNTYYGIYFTITGLHGLHVVGGAIVLGYYLFFGRRMYLSNPEWLANRVEVGGLFWHFVDIVWIFAFPIFYLM